MRRAAADVVARFLEERDFPLATTPGHRELTSTEAQQIAAIKAAEAAFLEELDQLPRGREVALAVTKVQEAAMWAVRGVTAPSATLAGR